jgi:hypothetical protein
MDKGMPDVTVKRRSVPPYPTVLAAEIVELPQVRLRFTHDDDVFEAVGCLV